MKSLKNVLIFGALCMGGQLFAAGEKYSCDFKRSDFGNEKLLTTFFVSTSDSEVPFFEFADLQVTTTCQIRSSQAQESTSLSCFINDNYAPGTVAMGTIKVGADNLHIGLARPNNTGVFELECVLK